MKLESALGFRRIKIYTENTQNKVMCQNQKNSLNFSKKVKHAWFRFKDHQR